MTSVKTCAVCGCTEPMACVLPTGEPCAWAIIPEAAADGPAICTACLPNMEVLIEAIAVEHSRNIKAVGYSAAWRTFEIRFVAGRIYRYGHVSEAVARPLLELGGGALHDPAVSAAGVVREALISHPELYPYLRKQ